MDNIEIKKELLEELKKDVEKDKLEIKIDRLESYLDKIYKCVNVSNRKEETPKEELPQHNLKKRALNQKYEDFRMDIFSDVLIVDKEITALEQMEKNLKVSDAFVDNFDKDDSFNLLFFGSEGTGKTFLSNHIANILIKEGYTVRKYSTVELFDFINEALIIDRHKNLEEYKMLTECDLLILDDLGTESNTSFTKSHLFSTLDTRFSKCKKTLLCTNLSVKDIMDRYEKRIFSRIVDDYYMCSFTGEDLRFKILEKRNYIK